MQNLHTGPSSGAFDLESLFILIPLSILALAVAIVFFFRMSSSGQFDDDQGPAWQVVLDDDRPEPQRGTHEQASSAHRDVARDAPADPID